MKRKMSQINLEQKTVTRFGKFIKNWFYVLNILNFFIIVGLLFAIVNLPNMNKRIKESKINSEKLSYIINQANDKCLHNELLSLIDSNRRFSSSLVSNFSFLTYSTFYSILINGVFIITLFVKRRDV